MDKAIRNLKQRVPTKHVTIPQSLLESLPNQRKFLSSISTDIEVNPAYFKPIFKEILAQQELHDYELLDDFYALYIEKLISAAELSPLDFDFLTYEITSGIQIVIKENPNLISGLNTTGFRTWEASVYLTHYLIAEYLPKHPEYNSILELGTGTGLVGLSLNKLYPDKQIYMTDGDSQLVQNLADNFTRNEIPMQNCFQYVWGDDAPLSDVDLCVGADITYDVAILPTLVTTFKKLFEECQVKSVVIACTVRNKDTLIEFEKLLSVFQFHLLEILEVETMFIRPDSKFKVFEISRV